MSEQRSTLESTRKVSTSTSPPTEARHNLASFDNAADAKFPGGGGDAPRSRSKRRRGAAGSATKAYRWREGPRGFAKG